MPTTILTKLGIRPGEARLVMLLFLEMFLLGLGFNFLETSAFPLFLVEFSAQTLPAIYILNAVVVAAVTWGYLQLGRRVSFGRQLVLTLAFLMALVALAWLGLRLDGGRWVVFSLPILFQIVVTLGNLGFWSMSNRLLTLRQSKRLIGLIGAGMWVAIVLTGFLMPQIVGWVGTVNLLALSAVGLGAALVLLVVIARENTPALAATIGGETRAGSSQRAVRALLANRYIALMFALTIVSWLAFYFVDNIFYNRVGAQFPTEAELSAFLGLYLAILGLFTLFNNFVLTGFIINRFGVRAGLLVLPLALLLVTGAIAIVGTGWGIVPLLFWLATLNKVLDLGLAFSVDQSAQTILYQALPAAERTRIQTIDTGIVRMIAVGLAGVLLLLLNQVLAFDVVQLAYVLLVIVLLWLAGVFLTGRAYPRALIDALAQRRLTGLALTLDDPLTAEAVRATLGNPQPGPALFALNLLLDQDPAAAEAYLRQALAHPSPAVRREAIRRAGSMVPNDSLDPLIDALAAEDADNDVRAAALRSPGGGASALTALADPDPQLRQAAIAGLLCRPPGAERELAIRALAELAASPVTADRVAAAEIIAQTAAPNAAGTMTALLADDAPAVRRAALNAAAVLDRPALWIAVVAALDDPATRQASAAALVGAAPLGSPGLAAAVRAAWVEPATSPTAIVVLAGIIAVGDEAVPLLRRRLDATDTNIRLAVLEALRRAGYQAKTPEEQACITAEIDRELAQAAWLLALARDGGHVPELAYLGRLAGERLRGAQARVLLLLSTLYDPAALDRVRRNVTSSLDERRSYALEILDTTLPAAVKGRVMPLLEELSDEQRLARLAGYAPPPLEPDARVASAFDEGRLGDAWFHVACVHALGELGYRSPDTRTRLKRYTQSPDLLLQQTALQALAKLDPNQPDQKVGGEDAMLSTIEKVILLKDVDLFSEMPDELLAEVASLLTEVELAAEQPVFAKGAPGDSLYIVVDGEVRVYDGDQTINYLGEGEVFGEMALLDNEPRMAAVMAACDTLLLRLEQEPFFDLMETRSEVARGVIRVLSARLRSRVAEVTRLRDQTQGTTAVQ